MKALFVWVDGLRGPRPLIVFDAHPESMKGLSVLRQHDLPVEQQGLSINDLATLYPAPVRAEVPFQ